MEVVMGFIFKNNKLLLIEHKRKGMWLPVGGHVGEGENLIEALKREIKEEVNSDIELIRGPFSVLNEPNETTYHYICLSDSGQVLLKEDEVTDFKWLSEPDINNSDLHPEVRRVCQLAFKELKKCTRCRKGYKIKDGVPYMLIE